MAPQLRRISLGSAIIRVLALAVALTLTQTCRGAQDDEIMQSAFAMTVLDVFEIEGREPVVTGRITAGRIALGDRILLVSGPDTVSCTVSSIEKFRKVGLKEVSAGPDAVALQLGGVSPAQVRRALTYGRLTLVAPP